MKNENLNRTIDLRTIIDQEREKDLIKSGLRPSCTIMDSLYINFPKVFKTLVICGLCYVLWWTYWVVETFAYDDIQNKIRLERLEICEEAYKNSWINEQFLYEQIPAVRCATYMTLIYAFESNFWKSEKCVNQKNCHGMKWNWYDTPKWFLIFNSFTDWRKYFAKKYFRWHYKKNIRTFVYNWSMTDQEVYTEFVTTRYWKIYNELENLYITWNPLR